MEFESQSNERQWTDERINGIIQSNVVDYIVDGELDEDETVKKTTDGFKFIDPSFEVTKEIEQRIREAYRREMQS